MMIAVQMNKKDEFDALWNWAMTHMYISDPAHPSYGYFSWSAKTRWDGARGDACSGWRGVFCDVAAVCGESVGQR